MHKLIETYFKEGKSPRQLTDIYLRDFKKEVIGRAPSKTVFGNYFTGGLRYLRGIHPFPYRPVAIEKKVDFKVNGIPFIGYIDFLGELDGSLYVVDNKSRVLKPRSKREKPTKTDEELDAYLMLEAGVPLIVIKNFLGHSSLQTTQVYAAVSQCTLNKHIQDWNKKWFSDDGSLEHQLKAEIPSFLI